MAIKRLGTAFAHLVIILYELDEREKKMLLIWG